MSVYKIWFQVWTIHKLSASILEFTHTDYKEELQLRPAWSIGQSIALEDRNSWEHAHSRGESTCPKLCTLRTRAQDHPRDVFSKHAKPSKEDVELVMCDKAKIESTTKEYSIATSPSMRRLNSYPDMNALVNKTPCPMQHIKPKLCSSISGITWWGSHKPSLPLKSSPSHTVLLIFYLRPFISRCPDLKFSAGCKTAPQKLLKGKLVVWARE